ncbi:SigB/SigF/SigG family RNA polymerase sigma factor [Pseudonocardia xinjiangensis]|uniref:SigB/SigF/SigG family RNA polymerase sigma factor n=1 Tax=Pseudonocardia xinjiangensis TaxID=75289 RepID=UPI003D91D946
MHVAVGRRGDETVLWIHGEVDGATGSQFTAALAVGLAVGGGTLVVDLREVAFIDCGGMAALSQAARLACAGGRSLRIVPGAAADNLAALLGGWVDVPDGVLVANVEQQMPALRSALTVGVAEPSGGTLVLCPDGEVDLGTVGLFGDVVNSAVSAAGKIAARLVVLGLDRVQFMSAAGVAVLCQGHRRANTAGVAFRLAGGPPVVRRILDVTGITAATQHYDSVADAVAGVRPHALRGEVGGNRRRDEYAHLISLFAERVRLPVDHPRQQVLRAELIKGYLPVAQHLARKHRHRGENLDDLEQVATLGLINAVDRFEPERGFDFLSFAIPTINGEVRRHYRDRTSTIRVPRSIRQLQGQMYQAADELSQKLRRAATPSELARHLDVDLDSVIEALQAAYETRYSSLDEPNHNDDTGSGGGTRFAHALGALDLELDLVESRESLASSLDKLSERERKIVLLRFYGNMSQTEIAKRTGISQMHVSRLLTSTLALLRRQLVE